MACRRNKVCLLLAIGILVLGLLQLGLGVVLSLHEEHNLKCPQLKHMVVGVYLVIAGIAGILSYCPTRNSQSKASIAVFIIFCTLVSVVVILDDVALNCIQARGDSTAPLVLVEVAGMHLAQLLCAFGIGLALADLVSKKYQKMLDKPLKRKTHKQALHLPEAHTHVQEAAGTGDKVTVVSLPETDGIVYAVPEEQYVIRKGEATYMAPEGNSSLTAFFPTYRIQKVGTYD